MQTLVTQQAKLMEDQLRRRLKEIDNQISRLQKERESVEGRLSLIEKARAPAAKAAPDLKVLCPKCGRDHDFLTDAGGYLAHVLEEPGDTELLESGKPLFCPQCGEVFLFQKTSAPGKKKR